MGKAMSVARSAAWITIAIAVPLIAIAVFLGDLFALDWREWAIAGTIVAGMFGAIMTFRRDSMARALAWFASLAIVTLLLIYDVLDAIIDPFIAADWPISVVAIAVVASLGSLLSSLISEDD